MHEFREHLATLAGVVALAGALVVAGAQTARAAPPAEDVVCTGCVDTTDIADNAVTGGKIADGAVGSADIADWSVTGSKLAGDAVFARIIRVRSDGTPSENCDTLMAALNGISGTSETNRYVVRLDAGVYDCGVITGSPHIFVPPYVTLQGAGVHATTITADYYASNNNVGLVRLGAITELRDLTVENRSASFAYNSISRYNTLCEESLPARITNVAVTFMQTPSLARALALHCGETTITDVRIDLPDATSIINAINVYAGAAANLDNVTATTGFAPATNTILRVNGGHASVRNSVFKGSIGGTVNAAVYSSSGGTADLASTQLDGDVLVESVGAVRCVFSYDGDYVPLPADCGAILY